MALIKWIGEDLPDPFREFAEWEGDMAKWAGHRLFPSRWVPLANGGQWWPETDVTEEKDQVLIRVDLPGMKQDEISVEVSGGILTIKGERKRESEAKEGKVYRTERSYGSFLRSFALPAGVEAAKVHATYTQGVLEVSLPKRAEATAKQIKVDVK